MKKQLIIIFFLPILLLNCTMKQQQDTFNKKEYQELHKHQGTENYEVLPLFNKNSLKDEILLDKKQKILSVVAKDLKKSKFERKKIDVFGNIIDKGDIYTTLKDGTMWFTDAYSNWLINGDTTEHKYIDPFSNKEIKDPYNFIAKEKNFNKWLAKFKELYRKATYVYTNGSFYYLKVDNKWYLFRDNLKDSPMDFNKQYPNKENQDIRMVALKDMSPQYFVPPNERDTQLIRERDYEEKFYETKDWGIFSDGYSAGWWYLDIYMPLGDVVRIKRFAPFSNPEIELYKIPATYGGRNDVLFIVQKPRDMHKEQTAGMYVIRPRDPKQPQQRYKLIKYKRDDEGYKIIDKEESIETEEYKNWIKKKKQNY